MTVEAAHRWIELNDADAGDAIVAAMGHGGVELLFFHSGAEIAFFQEAVAKAHALGLPAPRLITMTHEHAGLNAALGYAAVSGKPVATAAHVDAGTLNYGGAIHSALHSGLPVLITAGAAPAAYPGTLRGAREGGGHIWKQQAYDQNGIVRPYVKWDHRLEYQDNPGLIVSRALAVALTEPRGPVYLSIPRELALLDARERSFPSAAQLGIARPAAPDLDAIAEIAARLVAARNPFLVVSESGQDTATVPALVQLCESLALPVVNSAQKQYLCFPKNHPLWVGRADLSAADVVLSLQAAIPWVPGPTAPGPDAWVATIDLDPAKLRTPTFEFTADVRVTSAPLAAIEALLDAVRGLLAAGDRSRIAERAARWDDHERARRAALETEIAARATRTPIDPLWLSHQIGRFAGTDTIVLDETLPGNDLDRYLHCAEPGSFFGNPASSGGWSTGAAFGAKLAAPERDVLACTGDGFYMFSTANAVLWAAAHYGAPFTSVIYQNRSYSTGTTQIARMYPDGYAAKAGYEGGVFDPPIDFAMEAVACGAHGENVRDPGEILPALQRARAANRGGVPAVVSVWLPRLDESAARPKTDKD